MITWPRAYAHAGPAFAAHIYLHCFTDLRAVIIPVIQAPFDFPFSANNGAQAMLNAYFKFSHAESIFIRSLDYSRQQGKQVFYIIFKVPHLITVTRNVRIE